MAKARPRWRTYWNGQYIEYAGLPVKLSVVVRLLNEAGIVKPGYKVSAPRRRKAK